MATWTGQKEHLAHARKVTPGGGQTRSRTPGHVGPVDTGLPFPLFAWRAVGARVYSGRTSDHGLLDCFGANAAVPMGHAHPSVVELVEEQLRNGSLPSLASYEEAYVSALFLERVAPWAEQVRWVKTGTEALMAAVRIARAHTGRDRVVVMDSSYHGWSDLNDARFAQQGQKNGVPMATAALTSVMPYHEKNIYDYLDRSVAAVLVEPHRWIKTDREWLSDLCAAARTLGILVVFDEMVYGLRWALGGATEYYGVQPDLACFGKALGGGIPVACVCGKSEVMEQAARYVSGTYFGDMLGLGAVHGVLRLYEHQDIIAQLWRRGELTWHGFSSAYKGNAARLDGFFVHWRLLLDDIQLMDRVQVLAAERGVLFHKASNNASAAMTDTEAYDAGLIIGGAVTDALEGR